ncbi:alanine racemase [Escherichia coli]
MRHNLQRLRELAPASKMVAVVKLMLMVTVFLRCANAPRRRRLWRSPSRRSSATACGGITKPVLLLEGFFDARDLPTISAQHFHTAVHNEATAGCAGRG